MDEKLSAQFTRLHEMGKRLRERNEELSRYEGCEGIQEVIESGQTAYQAFFTSSSFGFAFSEAIDNKIK
jgi:hypothetical protein